MARTLDRRQLVERSIIKKYRKELWSSVILAVKRYELVREGDRITMDLEKGTVTLEVPEEELEARRREWVCPPPKVTKGVLALYAALCRPPEEGGAMQLW